MRQHFKMTEMATVKQINSNDLKMNELRTSIWCLVGRIEPTHGRFTAD